MKYTQGQKITGFNLPPEEYYEPDEWEYELSDAETIAEMILDKVVEAIEEETPIIDFRETKKAFLRCSENTPEAFLNLIEEWDKKGYIDEYEDVVLPLLEMQSEPDDL